MYPVSPSVSSAVRFFFFSSRRRHTRLQGDWSSDVCSSDLELVVFSGTGTSGPLSDTWVWNGTSWTQRATTSAPPPRWTATMAYDPVRTGSVLFGGIDVTTNTFLADTWTWDGRAWNEVTTAVAPPARYFAAMAFDEERNQTVLHAGAV